jgi:putative FmdB family regulatory protein
MPTYKYKREDGTTFEVRQSIKADALEECPETGQKVKRVISGGGGMVFKGDGFYVNDYKKDGRNRSSNGDSGNNGESADDSSTESTQTSSADSNGSSSN